MGVEWDKIGQNNSHALRNLGSFPQTLSAVLGYTALGSEPAETRVSAYPIKKSFRGEKGGEFGLSDACHV